ncbi:MAG: hypothetical protein AAB597_00630 [Patescibacteria group bacterium]
MNTVIWLLVLVSFSISYWIGRKLKTYWSLLIAPVVGLIVAGLSVALYFNYGNLERFGLGIIAILVALIVISSVLHLLGSVVGAWIGTYVGRKKSEGK